MMTRSKGLLILIAALVCSLAASSALAGTLLYSFDPNNRLDSVAPAVGNSSFYTYDRTGNIRAVGASRLDITTDYPSHDFGGAFVYNSTSAFTFVLDNNSTRSITINSVSIDGGDAGDFTLVSDACTDETLLYNSCLIQVRYSPVTEGGTGSTP